MNKKRFVFFLGIISFIVLHFSLIASTSYERERLDCSNLCASRIPVYIYSDFGGGWISDRWISDWQTADELASQAWRSVGYPELFINDTAAALSPEHASIALGLKFPYREGILERRDRKKDCSSVKRIVVHVVDPGVENESDRGDHHPRSVVLRKDGVLFIGPDNGALSSAVPEGSLEGVWKVDIDSLSKISGIDLSSGGTFHGRDVFVELAVRIASGSLSWEECSLPYENLKLFKRFSDAEIEKARETFEGEILGFESVRTDFCIKEWPEAESWEARFSGAFYLQMAQSSLVSEGSFRPKVFWIDSPSKEASVAIVNRLTGNIYIGPNNGWGSSFFSRYPSDEVFFRQVSDELLKKLRSKDFDTKEIYDDIFSSPLFEEEVLSLPIGYEESIFYDESGKARFLFGRIWVDAYGNIKTTIRSDVLLRLWDKKKPLLIEINGIFRKSIWADSFVEVPEDQLFCYAGSSAAAGYNPKRSVRYIEISANGRFGKFGNDFFLNGNSFPKTAQSVSIWLP